MKKKFFPKEIVHLKNMPDEVLDKVTKFLFLNMFIIILGIAFSLAYFNLFFLVVAICFCLVYTAVFFGLFYQHFFFNNIIYYDGEILSFTEWSPTNSAFINNRARKIYYRYARSTFRFKIKDSKDHFIKEIDIVYPYNQRKKYKEGMNLRIYTLPTYIVEKKGNDALISHFLLAAIID